MWRILKFLWTGQWKIPHTIPPCKHVWNNIQEIEIWNTGQSKETGNRPAGIRYILQCKKCGEIIKRGD